MNIIINATCLTANGNTGIERFALHICKELYRIDNSVNIVSSLPIAGLPFAGAPCILKSAQQFLGKNEYYVRGLWDQTLFRSFVARHKADVVFFPIQDGMLFPPARQIVTVHDLHYLHFDEDVPECQREIPAHRRLLYRHKMPHILRKSAAIVTVSEVTKNDLEATYKIDPDKIHVIYNGYDEARFRILSDPYPVLARYGLQDGEYFLYVGSILKHKNITRLVRAFAMLNGNSILVLAGVCKDRPYLKEIMKTIDELRLPLEKIRYLDYVSDEDLPYLYNGATALLLPSLHEGFGVPIIEAMACGTPVITSNCSAMPEIAGNAALLVDPYSVKSIAAAMQELLNNLQHAEALRMAGLERVTMFKWSTSAQKLYDLCKSVSES
ncbi:glycosyltransferase family 4 protein [Oryzomonas japonica]|uniref:Glycosyltransferase family 4 protein n=1 Tax=Oryzomonas japonica TaxID=2603858 RepID=A0A7J4ZPN0_9BACT|nr:glycosyltransferase family 1 protein [Oryzomonas japonica]KAB0664866.1 glycosyltransferase family 4 protein [Oryzomonas japonica]